MRARVSGMAVLWGVLTAGVPGTPREPASPPRVERLHVTEGRLSSLPGGALRIDEPRVRAVVAPPGASRRSVRAPAPPGGPRVVELRFTYRGPTPQQRPLLSGESRRQVGLKLRARDGCNVVYVMWRLEPKPGLVVSVKSNPEQHRSVDCGNGGYETVKPAVSQPVPPLQPGDRHTLGARLEGARLTVRADGESVWEGELPAEALAFDGPAGLRADNGRFDVELRATP
ncbi:MAG: hypothetical protein ABW123_15145 [Cystobacter sp.]